MYKHKIKLNEPSPAELDFRLSGSWMGMIWRISAMEQFGNICVNWEAVKVSDEYINLLEKVDGGV